MVLSTREVTPARPAKVPRLFGGGERSLLFLGKQELSTSQWGFRHPTTKPYIGTICHEHSTMVSWWARVTYSLQGTVAWTRRSLTALSQPSQHTVQCSESKDYLFKTRGHYLIIGMFLPQSYIKTQNRKHISRFTFETKGCAGGAISSLFWALSAGGTAVNPEPRIHASQHKSKCSAHFVGLFPRRACSSLTRSPY